MNTEIVPAPTRSDSPARILLGVCGGIAAYKSAQLVRLLTAAGAEVQVVMTEAASHFVGAATFQALTGRTVRSELWDAQAEAAMGHIELARWADLIVIAPATANTLARLRMGAADDLLTTLCLASNAPLCLAPAMNQAMWRHPATQDNIRVLTERGAQIIGPEQGDQACGDIGPGRMAEPEAIRDAVMQILSTAERGPAALSGRQVVITAGPTYEDIDPVRFIGNRSSGRMGYALAAAARAAGAEVILISGPVNLPAPPQVRVVPVRTAVAMEQAVMQQMAQCDIFIAAAAVADYRVAEPSTQKIKKRYGKKRYGKNHNGQNHDGQQHNGGSSQAEGLQLQLVPNPDILASVAGLENAPFCVGFAAETQNLRENARAKRQRKGVQIIAANRVDDGRGFDRDDNALLVIDELGEHELPLTNKVQLARQLMDIIVQRFMDWSATQSGTA